MPLAVQVVKRSIARKTRRGCLENPSPEATLWTPDKRPDESGRARHECPRHIVRRAGDFGEAAGATVAGPSIVDYKADDCTYECGHSNRV